ncbi:hypothetical protein CEXT_470821 [Caerostris extrusa]|uniref:Uncharacterized protein n=1 Tax=Caerostris extrusa TaxID=172846 RepID=A0AAV4WXD4_CAEEX|nr:hypothetical protein CEXT_470821 [Caerostris extrusa]
MLGSDDNIKVVPSSSDRNRLSETTPPDARVRSPLLTTLFDEFIFNHAKKSDELKFKSLARHQLVLTSSLTTTQIWPSYISKLSKLPKRRCSH